MSYLGALVCFSNSTLLEGLLSHNLYRNSLQLWHGQEAHQSPWENMVPPERTCYTTPADTLCPKTAALQAWLQQQHPPKLYCQGSLEQFSAGSDWCFEVCLVLLSSTTWAYPTSWDFTGHMWLAGKSRL